MIETLPMLVVLRTGTLVRDGYIISELAHIDLGDTLGSSGAAM